MGPQVQIPKAKAKPPTPRGDMNKTEAKYAAHLEDLKTLGEILWWGWETLRLKLGPKTYLTPDFTVIGADRTIEVRDTKGAKRTKGGRCVPWIEEDAAVKLKLAAELLPWLVVKSTWYDAKLGTWLERVY